MVRVDRLAKYTPASCSARLRRQNAIRSSSIAALALGARDEHLEHVGQHRPRAVAAGGDVKRDLAPAEDGQPLRGGEPG